MGTNPWANRAAGAAPAAGGDAEERAALMEEVRAEVREDVRKRFGDDKNLDPPAATLSFTAKGTGEAEVKITSAKVDIGSQAVGSDAPMHISSTPPPSSP